MRLLFAITILMLLSAFSRGGEEALEAIRRYAVKRDISEKSLEAGLKGAVWKKDKSAVALCFLHPDASLCLVAYRSANGYSISDVSRVEGMNFGKLGFERPIYDRFVTEATEWNETGSFIYTNFGGRARHQVSFRTRAWLDGQRFTVTEPLILDEEWKPLWR